MGAAYAGWMKTVPMSEATERLRDLPGWTLSEGALQRKFTFDGFPEAVAFVVRLGFQAESVDHHPDMLINYKRVTLTYVTHSEGGLTEKDFEGAATATKLAERAGGT